MSDKLENRDRIFPPEYYMCTVANKIKKKGRWFCNRPLSPIQVQSGTITSSDESANKSNEGQDANATILAPEQIMDASDEPHSAGDDDDNIADSDFILIDAESQNATVLAPEQIMDASDEPHSPDDDDDNIADPDFILSDAESESTAESNDEDVALLEECNSSEHLLPSKDEITQQSEVARISNDLKRNGEVRKGKKGKDFCFFCETSVLNFARHIQRNHSMEIEVQKFFSFDAGSEERKKLLALLRKKGNYLNSNNSIKAVKKPIFGRNLLPCSNCLGFYSAKQLWRHRRKCTDTGDGKHQANAQNFLIQNLKIDQQLR